MDYESMLRVGVTVAFLALTFGCGGESDGGMVDPETPSLTIERVSGDGQTAGTDGELTDPLVVRVVRDDGATVAGEEVGWTVSESPGGGAELIAAESETDAQGRAATRLVLGPATGTYRVTASLRDEGSVQFSATAEERTFRRLTRVSGNDQSGEVGEEVSDSLVVRSHDQFDDPIGDVSVAFEVSRGASGNPEVSPSSVETDSSGRAAASLLLGDKNGTYGVRAVAGRDTVTFLAAASGGTEFLLSLEDVTPATLEAGGEATLTGAGFDADPSNNDVIVDGRSAGVLSASESELIVSVPTYEDQCLPRRNVEVRVVVSPDTSEAVVRELTPSVSILNLGAGEDTVLVGPDEVGCLMLPESSSGGGEYEVMATPLPDALGTSAMRLFVNGNSPLSSPNEAEPSERLRLGANVTTGPGGSADLRSWKESQYKWDRRLRQREKEWLTDIRARAAIAPSMSRTVGSLMPATAAVGDTATFSVTCTDQGQVFAEVQATSEAAVIYEDTVMASRDAGLSTAQYDSIAARFDTLSFAVDTLYFGAPKDIDENGRVIMLFTPAVNRVDGNYSDGFIVGFFCGLDLIAGNQGEMFYLVSPDPDGSFTPADDGTLPKEFVRSIIEGTVIHEFQHLINAQIGGGSGPDEVSGGGAQEVWLNEGLSHLAEEVGGHAVTGFEPRTELTAVDLTSHTEALNQFYRSNFRNLATHLEAPSQGEGLISGGAGFATRGAAWSFVRYILDRFKSSDEHELTRALIQSSEPNARDAVEDATGAASAEEGVSFERIVADWSSMFSLEDRTDLSGSPRSELGLSSYRLRNVYGDATFGSGGSYPLQPDEVPLHESTTVSAELFTGGARYVRLLSTSSSVGTGLRLATESGEDLDASVVPHLIITRTK